MLLIINRFSDSRHLTKTLILQLITTKSSITKSNFAAFFTKLQLITDNQIERVYPQPVMVFSVLLKPIEHEYIVLFVIISTTLIKK